MTADTVSTTTLLSNLNDALSAAITAFPADEQSILPPIDGISLLDVKNDLLLSYLQNLVFLILIRLRNGQGATESHKEDLSTEVIQKLIELRVYVERGVRPLEGRLRYQIDKVLRATEEKERLAAAQNSLKAVSTKKAQKATGSVRKQNGADMSNSGSDSEDTDDASEVSDEDFENNQDIEETLHRPNALALARQVKDSTKASTKSSSRTTTSSTGAYKPPRITPTTMPEPVSARSRADERSRRRKANLLDEYIDEEMSSAPKAQPSIGSNSTILGRGRGGMSTRDREKERERTEYEETNLVRLPAESKAERRKARLRGDRNQRDMFGGEDWTGLGGLGDQINRSVQQGKGRAGVLERREKRGRDTQDSQRGDGLGMGEKFAKRQKILEDRAERKRRKRG